MKTLIVVAHADDETIAASKLMGTLPDDCIVLHTTDSAPKNPKYFERAGCRSREEYAALRRAELLAAMQVVGIRPAQCHMVSVADQEAVLHLERIKKTIAGFFPVDRIITHAYEGGHPDHDATALAAAMATACTAVELLEFPAYHAAGGVLVAGQFIPNRSRPDVELIPFNSEDIARKKAMFECFRSQQHLMERFSLTGELFRPAPEYDFLLPPHAGQLYYETRDLGWTYSRWREIVCAVLSSNK